MNSIIDIMINSMESGYIFAYIFILYLIIGVLSLARQALWDKTVKDVKCKITGTHLYLVEPKMSNPLDGGRNYPLTISEVETDKGKKRYVQMNIHQRQSQIAKNCEYADLYIDKTGSILANKYMKRLNHVAALVNVLGYYITWCILYWVIGKLMMWLLPDYQYLVQTIITFGCVAYTTYYFIMNYVLFNYLTKSNYIRSKQDFDLKKEKAKKK